METALVPLVTKLSFLSALLALGFDGALGQIADNETVFSNLSCYQCSESYHKKVWKPYTDCQRNPSRLHLRRCGLNDAYCKVERVEWNGFLVTMERGCTDSCYWGCRYEGLGITRLRCTSCCNRISGCNIDNAGSTVRPSHTTESRLLHTLTTWTTLLIFLQELIFSLPQF